MGSEGGAVAGAVAVVDFFSVLVCVEIAHWDASYKRRLFHLNKYFVHTAHPYYTGYPLLVFCRSNRISRCAVLVDIVEELEIPVSKLFED